MGFALLLEFILPKP